MIKIREANVYYDNKGVVKSYIVDNESENITIICSDPLYLISNIYQSFIFPSLEKLDFRLNENIEESKEKFIIHREERLDFKWFGLKEVKKVIEEKEYYFSNIILRPTKEIKLGILSKIFYKSSIQEYRIEEEYKDKFRFDDIYYFITPYLYCLNFLDWPDIDYWAERVLNKIITRKR